MREKVRMKIEGFDVANVIVSFYLEDREVQRKLAPGYVNMLYDSYLLARGKELYLRKDPDTEVVEFESVQHVVDGEALKSYRDLIGATSSKDLGRDYEMQLLDLMEERAKIQDQIEKLIAERERQKEIDSRFDVHSIVNSPS